jgi:hypothetical protein
MLCCKCFHKIILLQLYQVTILKKLYTNMKYLQKSLDEWLKYYNNERYHQGKICIGKPMYILLSGKLIEYEKNLNQI